MDVLKISSDLMNFRSISPNSAGSLEYVKKWAPEKWPLAFWDTLHLLPQRDFKYLEDEMRRIKTGIKADAIIDRNKKPRTKRVQNE